MRIGERRTIPEIPGHGARERSGKAAGHAGDSRAGAPGGFIAHLPAIGPMGGISLADTAQERQGVG